jgi:hypothetical protein
LPFDNIEQAKKHLRISSATALRNAVAAGDRHGFSQAAGVSADTMVAGHKFFDLVAHYLLPHREAQAAKDAAKAEKERLKAEKEKQKAEKAAMKQQKTKGPAQELAERSTSEKQARTMAAAAHDPKFAKKLGIKQSVAKEFNKADKGTKQLSNAMKHKRVSEELNKLYEAKARESLKKFEQDAIPGMTVYDSLNNSDSYASYRFGVALAPSPEFSDMSKKSALANSFAMIDYTDADAKIRKGAEKTMGVRSSSSTSAKSKELPNTNKLSPIANVKRNKYGI